MARQISEIQSLSLYHFIGAPLLALVQGQAQAAQATAEFIERVGLARAEGSDENAPARVRTVAVGYTKNGPDGETSNYRMEIPLLSLVPIPALEVKHADFEFSVKITDMVQSEIQTTLAEPQGEPTGWLSPTRVEFRAAMGKTVSKESQTQTLDLQMKVTMRVEQADVTTGMAHLFRLFDEAVRRQEEVP
jgi:hypothetical protein